MPVRACPGWSAIRDAFTARPLRGGQRRHDDVVNATLPAIQATLGQ
jgi:hypothetical protein